jgi:hypothetical protein
MFKTEYGGYDSAIPTDGVRIQFVHATHDSEPTTSPSSEPDEAMALGPTQFLIEMSTREYPLRSKSGRCVGLTTLLPSSVNFLEILGASNSCSPKGLSRPVHG